MSHRDVTRLLLQWSAGDQEALDRLLPLLYDHLKRLAQAHLRGERSGHTLNPTAVVHEAYLKLADIDRVQWQDRAHFLAVASRVMRRVLVDYARRRNAARRGGGVRAATLAEGFLLSDETAASFLELEDALGRLEAIYPRQGQAVALHYFGGLTLEESGAVLGVSAPTVMRDLRFAEGWLARAWSDERPPA